MFSEKILAQANRLLEAPWFLFLIPLLLLFLFLGKKGKTLGSARVIFDLSQNFIFHRVLRRVLFLFGPTLIFAGIMADIVALAGPRGLESKKIFHTVRGRIAVIINDISGSMLGERIADLQKANLAFLDEFCRKDQGQDLSINKVGLVTFSDAAQIRMIPTSDCGMIRRRVQSLETLSSTAVEKGLWTGLLILLEKADQGRIIPLPELMSIKASLKERTVLLPKRQKEFCERYQGLSLELFTDGDFPSQFEDRKTSLRWTATEKGRGYNINPFHVIDLAKALCIKTYFWSLGQLSPAYKEAFSNPPGTGFAFLASGLGPQRLAESFKEVARMEAGQLIIEETQIYNPLQFYFILAGLFGLAGGMLLAGSKNFLHNSGERMKEAE